MFLVSSAALPVISFQTSGAEILASRVHSRSIAPDAHPIGENPKLTKRNSGADGTPPGKDSGPPKVDQLPKPSNSSIKLGGDSTSLEMKLPDSTSHSSSTNFTSLEMKPANSTSYSSSTTLSDIGGSTDGSGSKEKISVNVGGDDCNKKRTKKAFTGDIKSPGVEKSPPQKPTPPQKTMPPQKMTPPDTKTPAKTQSHGESPTIVIEVNVNGCGPCSNGGALKDHTDSPPVTSGTGGEKPKNSTSLPPSKSPSPSITSPTTILPSGSANKTNSTTLPSHMPSPNQPQAITSPTNSSAPPANKSPLSPPSNPFAAGGDGRSCGVRKIGLPRLATEKKAILLWYFFVSGIMVMI
ncbi:hypothetical protein PCANC_10632 [Puccinia coronata f. sp. avenae]|uniref:Uncharacterized protein n=1 Tax=Puccinia coronata f. sp. avenae TaxID=200324 RepID=A0A2N5V465_9BASI|nr:hypothetical protein PCASD_23384 [Puccinia coronata f. sp. avenae]PLW39448.1 hypothetical protein PCASD_08029 [Puccinia coronata f. sp. avenae]PLW44769.1 hypothetical protein PCANC_10632 [Puccinia coronata f. sp. avenae]